MRRPQEKAYSRVQFREMRVSSINPADGPPLARIKLKPAITNASVSALSPEVLAITELSANRRLEK